MANVERKRLAHYIDASFDATGNNPTYVRLGKDLEEYNLELNPDVEVKKNILGETTINFSGYEPQSEVGTYRIDEDDPLYKQLEEIANGRLHGEECKTTTVDVLVDTKGKVLWAYREKAVVAPTSMGGDTSGVQIPFTIHNAGERVKGNWDVTAKSFTELPSGEE